MKKIYNTPELDVAKLNQIDTMTASGVSKNETDDNAYRNMRIFAFPGLED